MRTALIADIHGNLVALEAVLADIEAARVDQLICLGDVASSGPDPVRTLERLRATGCPVVAGNADASLLQVLDYEATVTAFRRGGFAAEDARRLVDVEVWAQQQLRPEHRAYLREFRPTLDVALDGGATLLCFHGSPRSHSEVITAATAEEDLDRMLGDTRATIMAGGHTHTPLLRRHRDTILVNPGSVGMPYEHSRTGKVRNPPWAEYAVVTAAGGRVEVEFRRLPLDPAAIRQAAYASGMPHAPWWANHWW